MATLDWSTTLVWSGLITPEKFNYLKEKVDAECGRRCNNNNGGSLENKVDPYTPTTKPIKNSKILKEHYEKIAKQVAAINKKMPIKYENSKYTFDTTKQIATNGDRIVSEEDFFDLETAINLYHQADDSDKWGDTGEAATGCEASCSGVCGYSCSSSCWESCGDDGCTDLCTTTCEGDCEDNCASDCTGSCGDGCSTDGCTSTCNTNCSTNCAIDGCSNYCTDECGEHCASGCGDECSDGCGTGCAWVCDDGNCYGQCSDACQVNCSPTCATNATGDDPPRPDTFSN